MNRPPHDPSQAKDIIDIKTNRSSIKQKRSCRSNNKDPVVFNIEIDCCLLLLLLLFIVSALPFACRSLHPCYDSSNFLLLPLPTLPLSAMLTRYQQSLLNAQAGPGGGGGPPPLPGPGDDDEDGDGDDEVSWNEAHEDDITDDNEPDEQVNNEVVEVPANDALLIAFKSFLTRIGFSVVLMRLPNFLQGDSHPWNPSRCKTKAASATCARASNAAPLAYLAPFWAPPVSCG
jgi:hypothetical protein